MRTFTYSVIDKRKKIWLNYLEQYSKNDKIKNNNEKLNQLNDTTIDNEKSINDKNDNKLDDLEKQQLNEDKKFQDFFTGTKSRLAFLGIKYLNCVLFNYLNYLILFLY